MSHSAVLIAISPTTDIEGAVSEQMAPFDENGVWGGEGTRWDGWQIGGRYSGRLLGRDVISRNEVDLEAMREDETSRYLSVYREAEANAGPLVELLYGVDPARTAVAEYLEEKVTDFPWFGAFLKDRIWQEQERLGWWGGTFKTECETATGENPNICIYHNEKDGARIISWNGDPNWRQKFFARFVEKLPPETLLVGVDYHV